MTEASDPSDAPPCRVSPRLLELLICPVSGGPLIFDKTRCELISKKAGLAFPIQEGVPVMLESEARSLDEDGSGR